MKTFFVMKFIESIKNLWKKIVDWVKGATNKVDDFMLKYAPMAINVINWVKEFNESGTADLIETILQKVDTKYGAKYKKTCSLEHVFIKNFPSIVLKIAMI